MHLICACVCLRVDGALGHSVLDNIRMADGITLTASMKSFLRKQASTPMSLPSSKTSLQTMKSIQTKRKELKAQQQVGSNL